MAKDINSVLKNAATYIVGASIDETSGVACRILGYHIAGGADAATLIIYDAITAAGTNFITVTAPILTTVSMYFGPNGILFSTGLTTALTGTTPNTVVFYVLDA